MSQTPPSDRDAARPPRFYAPSLAAPRVQLDAAEARHAAGVLRLRAGDAVELFDGRGASADGRLETVDRRRGVTVALGTVRPAADEPEAALHLAFAVPKGRRLPWLLEKTTELGARSLTAVACARSVAGGGADALADKRDAWQAHLVAAAKQCGRNRLPDLPTPATLEAYLARPRSGACLYGAVEGPPLAAGLGRAADEVHLLVGPEGGLNAAERDAATAGGFRPARVGSATLRVETAAVALLAAATALLEARPPTARGRRRP